MAAVTHRKSKDTVKMIRTTKEGRRLQYELYVLQQPERARACGSGAKCKLPGDARYNVYEC